ncbi:MAG: spore coat U domain-containing protein [Rhodanobacter sp.]
MKSLLLWSLLLFAASGLLAPLHAATCTISATGISFGSYDPTSGTAVTANGSLSFTCNNTLLGDTVTVTASTGSSGSYTNRTLVLGAQKLNYNIYVDSGYTSVFGNGTGGSYYLYACYGLGSGSPCPVTGGYPSGTTFTGAMYGLLPAGQDVSAGTYSDTITLTLTF